MRGLITRPAAGKRGGGKMRCRVARIVNAAMLAAAAVAAAAAVRVTAAAALAEGSAARSRQDAPCSSAIASVATNPTATANQRPAPGTTPSTTT